MKKEIDERMEYFHFCSKVIGLTVIHALEELEVKPGDSIGIVAYACDKLISSIALGLGLDPNKVLHDVASCMVIPVEEDDISHDMEAIIKEAKDIMNGKREE